MRTKTIEKIIKEFIAKELTLSPDDIHLDDNLVEDLHADSMDIVNVMTAIESRFKISFPEEMQVPYNGYTLRFLVDGTQNAIKQKNPVRRAVKAASTKAKSAEKKGQRKDAGQSKTETSEELPEQNDNL